MFEVTVIKEFAAAHKLLHYQGKCQHLHGHSWKVELTVVGSELDHRGMLIDFRDVKNLLTAILEKYDHAYLNDIPPFDMLNPTAENLARIIFNDLKPLISALHIKQVKVWESSNCCAAYREDEI